MDNEVAKALHDGLDRLRAKGWIQLKLCDRTTGRVCARGALVDATPDLYLFDAKLTPAQQAADDLLNAVASEQFTDRCGGWREPIVEVNNHPDTTQEDVELVFEKAIVRAYGLEASA